MAIDPDLKDLEEELHLLVALEQQVASSQQTRWIPHTPTPKQAEFLGLRHREALFGGAAGGGKSDALLMGALEYVDVPRYSSILLRKSFPDLAQRGGLMDRAAEWLRPTSARWLEKQRLWRFPSGATLAFGYVETDNDRFRYQGGEYQFVGFDELTQHTELRYTYLLSRLRRVNVGPLAEVPIRMRSATNPGGVGHQWVAERFGIDQQGVQDEKQATNPETNELRKFVPSKLSDNPYLDEAEYRKSLAGLDRTTRAQLEDGLWILDTQGLIYPYAPGNFIRVMPDGLEDMIRVLGIDLGSSESKPTTAFVVSAFSKKIPGAVWHERAEVHAGMSVTDIARRILYLQAAYQVRTTVMDEGALGQGYGREMRRHHRVAVMAAEKHQKLGFRKLYRDAIEDRRVQIVKGACGPLFEEASKLQWNAEGTDNMKGRANHVTDAALYSWRRCTPYLSKMPQHTLARGSAEWWAREEQRMLEVDDAGLRAEQEAQSISYWN